MSGSSKKPKGPSALTGGGTPQPRIRPPRGETRGVTPKPRVRPPKPKK